MPKSPGQDELDTLREIAAVARKLNETSIEAYVAKNKPREEWCEYDEALLPLWIDLANKLNYLDL